MIYVHVPFCRSFCTYCDFYSEIAGSGINDCMERYASDLCAEIEDRREEIADSLTLNTLYIGGGTPSVLPVEVLRRIVNTLDCGPFEEFTIEVNPEDIVERGTAFVRELAELGVTRISMGVQSLDDDILRWMNRRHDSAHAREAFRILRETGLDLSIDLITGVPGMTDEILESTVDEVLAWRPEHISAYQLSVEEGSALARLIAEGKVAEAPEEQCRSQYGLLCSKLSAAGYHHYEISNWALPGHEARHNSAYWTRHPYAGLGPAAHSLRIFPDGRQVRSWNSRRPSGWTVEGSETLTPAEIREEEIMLGLRTDDGVPAEWLPKARVPAEWLPKAHAVDGRVRIPERDWFISDELIAELI